METAFNTPSTYDSTFMTPTASVAFTVIETIPETFPPFTGEVIITTGAILSTALLTDTVMEVVVALPAASVAVADKE